MHKMFGKMLMIWAGLSFVFAGSAGAMTLDCTISNYNDYPYSRASLEMLLPSQQHHVFNGQEVRINSVVGTVTQNDSSRLKWKYSTIVRRNNGMTATISYTLIRPSQMLIIRVHPGGITQRTNSVDARDFQFFIILEDDGYSDIVSVDRVTGKCVQSG